MDCQENEKHVRIREELSNVSFEDLNKLKEKLGSRVYNETIFGKRDIEKQEFNRKGKNSPLEMSSKLPISKYRQKVKIKKDIPRDPRFDSLCGTFDPKVFKRSYAFVNEYRENDLTALKKQLKTSQNPKEIEKIKYLIQRLENQVREENKLNKQKEKEVEEKKEIIESLKCGRKTNFKTKSEKKILNLVQQYEELKHSGKLKKHIERLRKKNLHKDRKALLE